MWDLHCGGKRVIGTDAEVVDQDVLEDDKGERQHSTPHPAGDKETSIKERERNAVRVK